MTADRRRAERERRAAARVPAVFAVKSVFAGACSWGRPRTSAPAGLTMRRPKDLPLTPGHRHRADLRAAGGRRACCALSALVVSDRLVGSFRRTGVRFLALAADQQQQIAGFCRAR